MIKKLLFSTMFLIAIVLMSPLFLYWWGLSNIDVFPQPSQVNLTSQQEQIIWSKEKEIGKPSVRELTPYSYIAHFNCIYKNGSNAKECMSEYPGLKISALAIRNHVAKQVEGKGSTVWQFTWTAYTIWVTRNWNVHQILATYHESYNI